MAEPDGQHGLLIRPNGLPEVLHVKQWDDEAICSALGCVEAESFPVTTVPGNLSLWQAHDLATEGRQRPVNLAAEALVGERNYVHLRGPALILGEAGLRPVDITALTFALAAVSN